MGVCVCHITRVSFVDAPIPVCDWEFLYRNHIVRSVVQLYTKNFQQPVNGLIRVANAWKCGGLC